jgi:Ser/Thr protein kinase RdoA (MazF antagonist)
MNKVNSNALSLTLQEVLEYYDFYSSNCITSLLGNGLINDTYLVNSKRNSFVLQRINDHVFKQPQLLSTNTDLINQHLSTKQQQGTYPLSIAKQLSNKNKDTLLQLNSGYWRAMEYVAKSYSIESVKTPQQAEKAASAFAQFSAALCDFPPENLAEIIPGFHDLSLRLTQLQSAIDADKVKRKAPCQSIIDACHAQHKFVAEVNNVTSTLCKKVTHNDTKINNLLFSTKTHQAIAVIDLDTCMPGFLMHDFGDMVRTCCSNLPEDSTDLANMNISKEIFESLATGYISTLSKHMNQAEKDSLLVGALLMPYLMAIRFLIDYLDGDNYFHVKHKRHNLARAENQLKLFTLLKQERTQLNAIIKNIV